jgi:DNA-directed RNA polymerase subunit RPC12/RpoP
MKDDLLNGLGHGPKVDPTRYPQVKCDKCGHNVFRSASIIYNVPGVVMGTGTEDIPWPVPVYVCDKCGTIIKTVRDELDKIEAEKEKNKEATQGTSLIL